MSLAFVFPGQGSQSIGMLAGFADVPVVKATFDEASAALNQDLWQLVTEGPVEALGATVNTQPVMLAAGVAVWRAWLATGGAKPALLAGHSLGEYTALVAADVLGFADAVQLVRLRAQAMQDAVPAGEGAMAAVLGLADADVVAACAEAAQGDVVQAVNFNSPGQIVIAGAKAAVERACEAAKARGAKRAMLLPVSVPSHCDLMRPAAEVLRARLDGIALNTPSIPVLHNADVASYQDAGQIKDALVRQLYQPVRWVETVQAMAAQGATVFAECGPGKVLASLDKRIASEAQHVALTDAASFDALKALL
ncbi:ACP S-malonyltransferase [Chitiniphilus eburneus]|uniref:Malonyl CoA-acyl carrier protein transacylase n=1 Tax=Chitiniphilus eburneus TaxID=2571148 RepID=A0A4U0Q198_9NEIS|nr:ACP S-malonyltransferase [Chitiniphilus eburneus]TJZ74783.1 ACP S-malonyltransferase [Chitiniphilus eburneus]